MAIIFKYGILIIAFVIPVLVYIFLRVFGQNSYAIPIYYEQQNDSLNISGCLSFRIPHAIDFKDIPGLSGVKIKAGNPVLINIVLDECLGCPPGLNELKRVLNRHPQIQTINIYSDLVTNLVVTESTDGLINQSVILLDLIQIMRCQLLLNVPLKSSVDILKENNQLVLLDNSGRIRGYYNQNDRQDIDRLIMEISILGQEPD
ncbi:MAG: hypothetical protein O2887_07635 [Bacteroidetes bacterium]|nr:hypothetical protein [Bacteroidota bacterium]MDA1120352.1 hypothetical protein [Bacteroidota bacterium]